MTRGGIGRDPGIQDPFFFYSPPLLEQFYTQWAAKERKTRKQPPLPPQDPIEITTYSTSAQDRFLGFKPGILKKNTTSLVESQHLTDPV